ncbi:hypothetical protein A3Z26_23585 [Salmonella enterica subsp. enterica serovar Montevideo]|nr:hypothetical protein [Salmonella enterica subsp. enterica serovar Montevideo]ECU6226411.1 hypothetical protein [Salmonella enterica subsp. enterica serovar Montevideo]
MMDDSTIYESNVPALVPETVPGPRPDNLQFRQAHVPVHSCILLSRHCCKVSDEAAFCLIQRPYISKTLLTRRISPRGSP